jgi:hypothetical protein
MLAVTVCGTTGSSFRLENPPRTESGEADKKSTLSFGIAKMNIR